MPPPPLSKAYEEGLTLNHPSSFSDGNEILEPDRELRPSPFVIGEDYELLAPLRNQRKYQPIISGEYPLGTKLRSGADRLMALNFDPLESMVETHRKVIVEIAYQDMLRSGQIVELDRNMKKRPWSPKTMNELLAQKANIEEKLLKYLYANPDKIQDDDNPNKDIPAFIVKLSAKPTIKEVTDARQSAV